MYLAHKRHILKLMGQTEDTCDRSAIDYAVAVRLRGTGHGQEDIEEILLAGAPRGRDNHDWPDYAARTAAAAFGEVGTLQLGRYQQYFQQWRRLEAEAIGSPEEVTQGK
jgi:hypothetical protein